MLFLTYLELIVTGLFYVNVHQVTQRTYEHIDSQRSYETLYSTRHCGVMAFYLVLYRKVDGLIADRIQRDQ